LERDMDLIRDLLLRIESASQKPSWKELTPEKDEAEAERVLAHLKLIQDAGFTKSMVVNMGGHRYPQNIELTWEGHKFLGDIRDPDIWGKTKQRAKGVANIGLGFLWEIAKAEMKAKLGLP
jgi:hypothetical protein